MPPGRSKIPSLPVKDQKDLRNSDARFYQVLAESKQSIQKCITDGSNSLVINSHKRIPAFNKTDMRFNYREEKTQELSKDKLQLGGTSQPTISTNVNPSQKSFAYIESNNTQSEIHLVSDRRGTEANQAYNGMSQDNIVFNNPRIVLSDERDIEKGFKNLENRSDYLKKMLRKKMATK